MSEAEVVSSSTAELEEAARGDLNFLGGLCLPDVFKFNFPPLFSSIYSLVKSRMLEARDFSKFAIGLPRGHAKTTFLKILIIFIILFTRKKFILVVCATEQLAINIISDVVDILDSPNIISIFGNWRAGGLETDTKAMKKAFFRGRNIIMVGLGSGGTLRGMNIKNSRPDCMIIDDLQTKEEAASPTVSKQLIQWFQGTLLKAKDPYSCTFMYVGNMYPDVKIGGSQSELYTCILRNLSKDPEWISIIVGGILSDGKALWEEVQPLKQLLSELVSDVRAGVGEVFFSEVMNDPQCGINSTFDISKMPAWSLNKEIQFKVGAFLLIDPSLGKKKSDAQIVGKFEVWDDGIPRLVELRVMQFSAPKVVEKCLDWAVADRIPAILAEAVAYQGTLLQWFEKEAQARQIEGIVFLPVQPNGRTKVARILQSFKSVLEHKLAIAPECLSQWLSQVITFDPMKANNTDDVLDVAAYGEDVVIQYPQEIIIQDFINAQYSYELDEPVSPI